MGKSEIVYVSHVWNPIQGCSKIGAGCQNCWAEDMIKRWSKYPEGAWSPHEEPGRLQEPLGNNKPSRYLVASLGDLFHPRIPFSYIERVFEVMQQTEEHGLGHKYMVLTKRIIRMQEFFNSENGRRYLERNPHVALGISVWDNDSARFMVSHLIDIPAACRFISYEPAIGAVDWENVRGEYDLIICGGESGFKARFMRPEWAQACRDWCNRKEIYFYFKQWGHYNYVLPARMCPKEKGKNRMRFDGVTYTVKRINGAGHDITKFEKLWDDDLDLWAVPTGNNKSGNMLDGKIHEQLPPQIMLPDELNRYMGEPPSGDGDTLIKCAL